jgi:hypothetical protein
MVCFSDVSAQFTDTIPHSLWIDKPVTKTDSLLLIRNNYHTITIYMLEINETPGGIVYYDSLVIGTWKLTISNERITSSVWKGTYKSFYEITSKTVKTHAIIETLGKNDDRYILTHHMDKSGTVTHTTNLIKSKYESLYRFKTIDYIYKNGLLQEADYDSSYSEKNSFPYRKFIYRYSN